MADKPLSHSERLGRILDAAADYLEHASGEELLEDAREEGRDPAQTWEHVKSVLISAVKNQMDKSLNSLAAEIMLLRSIQALNDDAIQQVVGFVCNTQSYSLARDHEACLKRRDVDLGFNLFAIVSDLYYRENFHSDILRALLDPKSQHEEGGKYLHLFLEFLRKHGAPVNIGDYTNTSVVREEGRVDILIKDEDSKKAIIVENKINEAGDMSRQIPRYLRYVRAMGYTCDAIIYLRLHGYGDPDKTGWTAEERRDVTGLLTVISAYDDTGNDLLNGWIKKSEEVSVNVDAKYIFRQYGALIKKLGGNVMNKPIMERFYSTMREGDNFKTAQSLRSMLEELVQYRVERLKDIFNSNCAPFQKVWNYSNHTAVFEGFIVGGSQLAIDVEVKPESYSITFFDRNPKSKEKNVPEKLLQQLGCAANYVQDKDRMRLTTAFAFPSQEDNVYEYLKSFLQKLSGAAHS